MNIQEIYGLLFAGKKIEMNFATLAELQAFKVRLHQVKFANEKSMIDVGMISEQEKQQLSVKLLNPGAASDCELRVQVFLSDRVPKKQYEVKILED